MNLNDQDPALTEVWEPQPPVITPGEGFNPPSDAFVLFDGKDLSQWEGKDGEAQWEVMDGVVTVKPGTGDITSKAVFGNVQLHMEWRSPSIIKGEGQMRGNSGVFLQKVYEVQILDSYENITYANGVAGSVYKQYIPLVNACRKPGEWQTYDIIFMAPEFDDSGNLIKPAYMTILHNGVLIQNHVELKGETQYIGQPFYRKHGKGPIMLQDHGDLVSFRNIWVRELA